MYIISKLHVNVCNNYYRYRCTIVAMDRSYWHKQSKGQPLFPDLLWSRPENRAHAGKLLIVGGNAMGFAAPAEAFAESAKAGIGSTRVILPASIQKTIPHGVIEAEFAPVTPSGSFAQESLGELLPASEWADAVLLAGDFGRNSETAIVLEKFAEKYEGPLALVGDSVDYFLNLASIVDRENTLLVLNFSQLQKLGVAAKTTTPFTSSMDFLHLLDALHQFSNAHRAYIVLANEKTVFVTVQGSISTTQFEQLPHTVTLGARATVWWLQNPAKSFESITTAVS